MKALADKGGVMGVYMLPFLTEDTRQPALADYMAHMVHALDVCGEDHVGIGTDFDGIARLGAALHERHGKLDILVGNAGIAGPSSPLGHIDLKPWNDVMAINVTANFQLIRCMEPLLKKSDAGRAVFVTSGLSWLARAYCGPYATSKAALNMMIQTYAAETATTNVRANLFNPGPTRTRMYASGWPGVDH